MKKTTNYVICRLCGFIMKVPKVPGTACPACGAPWSSFVPYVVNVEEKRLKLLEMDLHPISTHFGVGGTFLLAIVFFISIPFPSIFGVKLGYGGVLDFFVMLQPVFIGLTALAGLLDGKLRYKKYSTAFLRRKIILASIIAISTALVVIFHFNSAMGTSQIMVLLEGIMILVSLALAGMLGSIGGKLTCNVVPRGREAPEKKPEASSA